MIIQQTSSVWSFAAAAARIRQSIPVAVRVLVLLALLAIPVRIISYGFLPPDDALRHAAKAVSGKAWPEILVMRPDIAMDHNPGWHWILTCLHQVTGWGPRRLVQFSVVTLFLLVAWAPVLGLKRPELWLTSFGLMLLVFPYFAARVLVGRPLLLTMAVMLLLLQRWTRPEAGKLGESLLALILMTLSVWVHGSWYLLALLPMVFFLAQAWRNGLILFGCWVGGLLLGASLTGHPWAFLQQAMRILFLSLGNNAPLRSLVGEFQPLPFASAYPALIIMGVVVIWRILARRTISGLVYDPIFCMAVLGYGLGFWVLRFWLDWGIPALALWLATQLEELLESPLPGRSWIRVAVGGLAGLILLATVANDRDGRWKQYGAFEALDAKRPEHAGWVPEPGGILYCVDLSVFYETFFTNPHGDWRYALGFEPSLMRPEDLAVYQELWRTGNALKACAPWVRRMKPADRLVLHAPPQIRPALRELEWFYAVTNTWVGRLPSAANGPLGLR